MAIGIGLGLIGFYCLMALGSFSETVRADRPLAAQGEYTEPFKEKGRVRYITRAERVRANLLTAISLGSGAGFLTIALWMKRRVDKGPGSSPH